LDSIAERIVDLTSLASFDRLVCRNFVAGLLCFRHHAGKVVDDESRMRLARRDEIPVDAEMNRQRAVPEPATAARGKLRRLGDFGEPQNVLIKSSGLALAPGRYGDQDVVDGANGHWPPCMCRPALYTARHGLCQSG
jgi:hypothetical protein